MFKVNLFTQKENAREKKISLFYKIRSISTILPLLMAFVIFYNQSNAATDSNQTDLANNILIAAENNPGIKSAYHDWQSEIR